jgi:membrane-associated phospholipid phosphatase
MENLLNWGIEVILWIQTLRPALDVPLEAITFLGEEMFYLLMLPFIYWCIDRSIGASLAPLYLISAYINTLAKTLLYQPRPFQYDARVWVYDPEITRGGLPSGHTQQTVVVWGYLAAQFRRLWAANALALMDESTVVDTSAKSSASIRASALAKTMGLWIVAVALMLLVPFSRLYLGVHFPHDLLGGYLLGGVCLAAYLGLAPGIAQWLPTRSLSWQLALAIGLPLCMIALFPTEDGVATSATLIGMGVGFALDRRWLNFEIAEAWLRRTACYALGVLVLVGIWGGLKVVFATLEPTLVFRFIRYTLIGFWTAFGAPWVFVKLRLAHS